MEEEGAQTTTDLQLTTQTEWASVSYKKQKEVVVMTSLEAPLFEDDERAPLDLVVVIDKSSSMRADMELVHNTLFFVLSQLSPKDRFCIVSFGTDVWDELPMTCMDQKGKELAKNRIQGLEAKGTTNLSGGLLRGLRLLRERPLDQRNEVASLLLLTDGYANRGLKSAKQIKAAMTNPKYNQPVANAKPSGFSSKELVDTEPGIPCTVYTFGFGSTHNSSLLSEISEFGDGVYYYIEDKDCVSDNFADCLGADECGGPGPGGGVQGAEWGGGQRGVLRA